MNRAHAQWIAASGLIISSMTLLASCTSSDPTATKPAVLEPATAVQTPVVTTTPTAATQSSPSHWVQDSRLRMLMGLLSQQSSAVPGQGADVETPPGLIKNQPFDQAAILAEGLSQTALMIPRIPGRELLSEADRAGFDAQAARLHDLAQQLKTEAQAHQIERMQETMNTLSTTCTTCHTKYRDLTTVLQPRASLDLHRLVATAQ